MDVEAYIELISEVEKAAPRLNKTDRSNGRYTYKKQSEEFERRLVFCRHYAWAVPSRETIDRLVEFIGGSSVLEIGAGSGLWARLLQLKGVDIIPTDNMSEPRDRYFTKIENCDAETAMKKYADREVLLVCWPRMSLLESELRGWKKVIFIGEEDDGCTGIIVLNPENSQWREMGRINHPRWLAINDVTILYQRG